MMDRLVSNSGSTAGKSSRFAFLLALTTCAALILGGVSLYYRNSHILKSGDNGESDSEKNENQNLLDEARARAVPASSGELLLNQQALDAARKSEERSSSTELQHNQDLLDSVRPKAQ